MSKYQPLAEHLRNSPTDSVTLTFQRIEEIIGDDLPASARKYRPWWANAPNHTQARSWLSAGWETENVNMNGETAAFRR